MLSESFVFEELVQIQEATVGVIKDFSSSMPFGRRYLFKQHLPSR